MDPTFVPGTGVPEKDGLSPEEVNGMLASFFKNLPVVSMDLVEYNPRLDKDEKTYDDSCQSAYHRPAQANHIFQQH